MNSQRPGRPAAALEPALEPPGRVGVPDRDVAGATERAVAMDAENSVEEHGFGLARRARLAIKGQPAGVDVEDSRAATRPIEVEGDSRAGIALDVSVVVVQRRDRQRRSAEDDRGDGKSDQGASDHLTTTDPRSRSGSTHGSTSESLYAERPPESQVSAQRSITITSAMKPAIAVTPFG